MKPTLVISAFPACGKSYTYNNFNNQPYSMIDSDSSKFSWIYKDGVKTDERNPNFVEDYINHIKENIGKVDVIFVSSHKEVRQALRDNGIRYLMVYPALYMKDVMLQRMRDRGNTDGFVAFQEAHYEEFIKEIEDELAKISNDFVNGKYRRLPCYGIILNTLGVQYITNELICKLFTVMTQNETNDKSMSMFNYEINSKPFPEIASLRWLANQFQHIDDPQDDVDRMTNCINLYCTSAANRIEQIQKILNREGIEYEQQN